MNFRAGLTDAGLQEYLSASQMWHSLCRDPFPVAAAVRGHAAAKHQRQESTDGQLPLAKRVALKTARQGCRRIWTAEEALQALRHMYGPEAGYRSGRQAEAM